jgi:hypothetical protein
VTKQCRRDKESVAKSHRARIRSGKNWSKQRIATNEIKTNLKQEMLNLDYLKSTKQSFSHFNRQQPW